MYRRTQEQRKRRPAAAGKPLTAIMIWGPVGGISAWSGRFYQAADEPS